MEGEYRIYALHAALNVSIGAIRTKLKVDDLHVVIWQEEIKPKPQQGMCNIIDDFAKVNFDMDFDDIALGTIQRSLMQQTRDNRISLWGNQGVSRLIEYLKSASVSLWMSMVWHKLPID